MFNQAVLAGHLLTGNTGARTLHREIGTEVITWVALIVVVLTVVAWRPGRGPAWPIAVAILASYLALLVVLRRSRAAGPA